METYRGRDFDKTKLLICAFFNRPALWNSQNSQYKNMHLRQTLLDEVGSLLRMPRHRVQAEWDETLQKFKQECCKLCYHQYSGGPPFTSSWPYFDMLSFLKKPMLESINELPDKSTVTYNRQPRSGQFFTQFDRDVDFRTRHQLKHNLDFETRGPLMNERARMQQQYDARDFIPQQHLMDRRQLTGAQQPAAAQNELYLMNERQVMPRALPPDNMTVQTTRKWNTRKRKKNTNVSNSEKNIKSAKLDIDLKNSLDRDIAQKRNSSKNPRNLWRRKKGMLKATAKKLGVKKDGGNMNNELTFMNREFFYDLLPYMEKLPKAQKFVIKGKVMELVLDEHKKIMKN